MLSPSPISLLCALLLCLPLAIIFTITTPLTSSSVPTTNTPPRNTTSNIIHPKTISTNKTQEKNKEIHSARLPPPVARGGSTSSGAHKLQILNPPTLIASREEVDDDDSMLFQEAGRLSPIPKLVTAPKKLAFMFLTTTALPFAPLWEIFFNNTPKNLYNIYIHADPRFNYTPPFQGVFAHRVIPSKPTRRHSPTLTSAARRLLARALLHDKYNYMFALLSPSCIPLRSFNFTYTTLTKSRKSFIEVLGNESWAYGRYAARGEHAMLPEVKFDDFRIGSQFFVIKRKHAWIVVRDRRLWSKFKLPCLEASTCYPEEQYFSTLLNMVDPQGCVPATLTHVDWKGSHGGHPRTYTASEVSPELILTLRLARPRYGDEEINGSDLSVANKRHDPFLFARKFSLDSLQPLMNISREYIFKD
ncbi:glycosyltransferase BC10-like isoform X1 [Lycium barbarum]|uniref:glycosyltransferase BC10-like isoform X1 n=1 Tax=Lycium barbarum TaxID=112863 RepID=UPI00293E9E16|nr:glycosyltransferase BC10-like isoform X1 [Lycium barbarum]